MCAPTLLTGLHAPSLLSAQPRSQSQWIYVTERFKRFLSDISLTNAQLEDGYTKIRGVVKCLNRHYWSVESDSSNYLLVGSWGKQTRVRPPRDIDIMFLLPPDIHQRYQQRLSNIQSQLLQEVKNVLTNTYSTTRMRGDGQVVVVPFNSFLVEVVPAFELQTGKALICNSNNNGEYKTIDPVTEIKSFDAASKGSNGNSRDLVRMLKCWQTECNVPIKSYQLEALAVEFIEKWENKGNSLFWYDWMVRDFFAYLKTKANSFVFQPGSYDSSYLGSDWLVKAEKAHKAAVQACIYEESNSDILAQMYWKDIFGTEIKTVS